MVFMLHLPCSFKIFITVFALLKKSVNKNPFPLFFQKNIVVSIFVEIPERLIISLDVNFCKDHRDKIEVPDPLAVEDLISSKLNNKRKLARLITQ